MGPVFHANDLVVYDSSRCDVRVSRLPGPRACHTNGHAVTVPDTTVPTTSVSRGAALEAVPLSRTLAWPVLVCAAC